MLDDKNDEIIEIIDNFLELLKIHNKGYDIVIRMEHLKHDVKNFHISVSDPTYKAETGNTKVYGNVESINLKNALRIMVKHNFDGKSYIIH